MLTKRAIKKTVVCGWSAEDLCYVAQSPLFPRVLGTGNTALAAELDFNEVLEEIYFEIENGNVRGYDKRGRPSKGRIDVHFQIREQTKEVIDRISEDLDISKGEVIDYATRLASHAQLGTSANLWPNQWAQQALMQYDMVVIGGDQPFFARKSILSEQFAWQSTQQVV